MSISGVVPLGTNRLLSVHLNGRVDSYSLSTEDENMNLQLEGSSTASIANPVGLERIVQSGSYTDKVLLYNTQGSVSVYNTSNSKTLADFDVKGPLCASATCNEGQVLFGGKENDARLYSVETQKEIWAAKNVSQDKLHLRVPVWNTCLAFRDALSDCFADSADESSPVDSSIFYSGTAYRHVRMYDMKASRQPVVTFELGPDYRVSAIQPSRGSDSERLLYVADTAGFLTQWDMRMQRRLHTLKGAAGSIRKMMLSSDGQELACVGLDRFLRTYDTSSNKMTSAVYLKNRLNTCLIVGDNRSMRSKEEGEKSAKKPSSDKRSGGTERKGRKVANEEDEDLLQELGAGDSEEEEEDEEDEGGDDDGSDVASGSGSGDESGSDSEGEGELDDEVEMDSEDSQQSGEQEIDESGDSDEEGSEGDASEGSGDEEEGDEDEEEEEEVAVPVVSKGSKGGKPQRAPPAVSAHTNQAKKARR